MSLKDEVGEHSERRSLRLVSRLGLYLALRAEHPEAKLFQDAVKSSFPPRTWRPSRQRALPVPAPSVPAASKQASEEAAPFAYGLIIRAAARHAQRTESSGESRATAGRRLDMFNRRAIKGFFNGASSLTCISWSR